MYRLLAATVALLVAPLQGPQAAWAGGSGGNGDAGVGVGAGGITATVRSPGSPGTPQTGVSSAPASCGLVYIDGTDLPSLGANSTEGYWVVDMCVLSTGPGGMTWVPRTPGSTPAVAAVVAQTALSRATWPTIKIALSPPPERMLVNFPVWLHLASGWKKISTTAAINGLSATVTAKPESVRWDMGDGQTVTCRTPGAAYDPSLPWATNLDRRDCGYTYRRSSANQGADHFQLTITIRYVISWTSSTGGSGSLGGYDRNTTASVAVGQLESLEN